MKPWYKSLTFWGLIVTLLGLGTAGIGRGEPLFDIFGGPEAQDIIGQLMLMVGMGGAVLGRARAQGPVSFKKSKASGQTIPEAKNGPPPDCRPEAPTSPPSAERKGSKRPKTVAKPEPKPELPTIRCVLCKECGKAVVEDVT